MRVCVAQTKPVKGDIESNINSHKNLIDLAAANGAEIIIFPELSVIGYEPELAKELAIHQDDSRFDDFQKIADNKQITIGIGAPTQNIAGICISMIIFQPHKARQTYSKKYLHSDEEAFFVGGESSFGLLDNNAKIAFAICYEVSVQEHAENAFTSGAEIYIASVANSVNGTNKATKRLSEIANKYSMTVLMSSYVGYCANFECGGKTSIWNRNGLLLSQLDDANEGIIIVDTDTQKIIEKTI